MSYETGSNAATPGSANMGNGTITMINSVASGSGYTTGIYQVAFTGASTADHYTVTYPNGSSSPSLVLNTTTTTFSTTGAGVTFLITQGTTLFMNGESFSVFVSSEGQNTMDTAIQATGIEVTIQRFQASAGTPVTDWTSTIQALFDYCGRNPGVVGVIPPGLYVCTSTLPTPVVHLYVRSNMTIRAYGAIICTDIQNPPMGDDGFVCVDPTQPVTTPTFVTIMGGTWGALGKGGAAQTNNTAIYGGPRAGRIFNLFVDNLTLIDVTVRGWKGGPGTGGDAFSLGGKNMLLRKCSFWNSDEQKGSGGIRINFGDNIRVTDTSGRSGDDCLQFAPGHGAANLPISNAFFIGGNVHSVSARAAVATLIDMITPGMLTCSINNIGWIGIVGVSDGGSDNSLTGDVILIENQDAKLAITNVTVMGCKFTGKGTQTSSSTCRIIGTNQAAIPPASFTSGGVSGVHFIDVTFTSAPHVPLVYLDGWVDNTLSPNVATTTNINFRNCVFNQTASTTGTPVAPIQVNCCQGFSFKDCTVTAYGGLVNAMLLGVASGNANLVASYGIIEGCTFFTNSSSNPGQAPLIFVQAGDMNAIQGWCKFFVGTVPSLPSGGVAGSTTSGIQVASGVTNTFIDCVDLRGVNTATPVLDAGTGTRVGLNIVSQVPAGAIPLSVTKVTATLGSGTYTWPTGITTLEMTGSSTTAVTITLPSNPNEGEVLVIAAPFGSYSHVNFSPAVRGFTNSSPIDTMTPVQMMWGSVGHWFTI